MGSSFYIAHPMALATAFGLLFLVLDGARGMAVMLGPMRLRRWNGDRHSATNRLFPYTSQNFVLILGALVQIFLVLAVGFSLLAVASGGAGAMLGIAILWAFVVSLWKAILTLIPEEPGEQILLRILPITRIFYFLFWPLVFPIRWLSDLRTMKREHEDEEEEVTDEEVQAFIDVGEEEGILEEGEGKLVQSIVDFGDRLAHELMTPRIDVLAVDASTTIADAARIFNESKYSRLPIYEGNVDKIIGVVHVKDVFGAYMQGDGKTLRDLARPAYAVHETKRVAELLREFQIEHLQIAVVMDEYGGTAGIITIEDIIEEIVGDIADEHEDEEESVVELDGGAFLVNGHFRVDRLEELTGANLRGDDYETVAGLIFTTMGRVPRAGEQVSRNGYAFRVERADRKRIYRVRVSPETRERETAEDSER